MPAATVAAERGAHQVTLLLPAVAYGAAAVELVADYTLPLNFGDCLILELSLIMEGAATPVVPGAQSGARVLLIDLASLTFTDVVGIPEIRQTGTGRTAAQCTPDSLVVWKATETLRIVTPGQDSNVAPTANLQGVVRVRRLRDDPPQPPPWSVFHTSGIGDNTL